MQQIETFNDSTIAKTLKFNETHLPITSILMEERND